MTENYQLQFPDGSIVRRMARPSDFAIKEVAEEVAKELSVEWQTPIVVKQTV